MIYKIYIYVYEFIFFVTFSSILCMEKVDYRGDRKKLMFPILRSPDSNKGLKCSSLYMDPGLAIKLPNRRSSSFHKICSLRQNRYRYMKRFETNFKNRLSIGQKSQYSPKVMMFVPIKKSGCVLHLGHNPKIGILCAH